ncbi:hypothetical protein [Altericista sp. CCNU0014]|uniref:hypothetical protein n=1 Tax=Altericista sp. CCNU0014 TaxID=3082949 RepID=UPI00384B67CD
MVYKKVNKFNRKIDAAISSTKLNFNTKILFSILFIIGFYLSSTFVSFGLTSPEATTSSQNISRGETITYSFKNVLAQPQAKDSDVSLILDKENEIKAENIYFNSSNKFMIESADFIIPESAKLGKQARKIKLLSNSKSRIIPIKSNRLIISSFEGDLLPQIEAISPSTIFPSKNTYSFNLIGKDFSQKADDNKLKFSTQKDNKGKYIGAKNLDVCWIIDNNNDNSICDKNAIIGKVIDDREIEFKNISNANMSDGFLKEIGIQVQVGDKTSNFNTLFLSPVPKWIPIMASILGTIALSLLLLSISNSLFIDSETNTYSLSRFQFYIWTFTCILGYLLLLLSKTLIQGKADFIDIPSGLPSIILISGTTFALTEGISNAKGSKGAGDIKPKLKDFISTGGVVVPERVQLFIWTIIGVLTFIFVIFFRSPENIQDLPEIPQGFLQLMGVSSLGYIGGKTARKPGPIINGINADYNDQKLRLILYGSKLSPNCTCEINNQKVLSEFIEGNKPKVKENDSANDSSFANSLELIINFSDQYLIKEANNNKINKSSENILKIINPDGQYAEWGFKFLHEIQKQSQKD